MNANIEKLNQDYSLPIHITLVDYLNELTLNLKFYD